MKTKGGREMNPTDAYRKQARKREIKRNRAERHYIREAFSKKTQAQSLKEELEELIAVEQDGGELNKLQKLRKKVVMEAYEAAIRRQKEDELRKRQAEEEGKQLHGGLSSVPLPKPPPLPAGPKPGGLPPLPAAPPLPAGPAPTAAAGSAVLPPPPGPPPGVAAAAAPAADSSSVPVLPPPAGLPPSAAVLPPPPGPPPATAYGMLPPPAGPPPGAWLPPPTMPPPAASGILPPPAMPPPAAAAGGILPPPAMLPPGVPGGGSILPPPTSSTITAAAAVVKSAAAAKAGATTITGASTVAKRPLAHKDKKLTSMVPASVLVRREAAAAAAAANGNKRIDHSEELQIGPGFGLAPVQKSAIGQGYRSGGSKLTQQLQQPQEQGKWGSVVQTYVAPVGQSKGGGKPASVDAKMADFMDSLKDLGAFDQS